MENNYSIIQVNNVEKSFANHKVIDGVSLQVGRGDAVALLGVRGSGKTTLLNLILGLEKPSAGTIALYGAAPNKKLVQNRIAIAPQQTDLPKTLRADETIELVQAHYSDPHTTNYIAEQFGLSKFLRRVVGNLTQEQQCRLALAVGFVGKPECVILDEPTAGLDINTKQQLWQSIHHYLADGGAIFVATNNLDEATALATRIVLLHEGRIRAEGNLTEIKALMGMTTVAFYSDLNNIELQYVNAIESRAGHYVLHTEDSDALIKELIHRDIAFRDLEVKRNSLESAFVEIN